MWDSIKDIPGIEARSMPKGSYETADALVFFLKSIDLAKKCRDNLLEKGLSTKILPEAFTWHFAGSWSHMRELQDSHCNNIESDLLESYELLSKAVAIPITVKDQTNIAPILRNAIVKTIK